MIAWIAVASRLIPTGLRVLLEGVALVLFTVTMLVLCGVLQCGCLAWRGLCRIKSGSGMAA